MKCIPLLWFLVTLSYVCGYHDGAPGSSCNDMDADHNDTYQFGPMPYILNVSSDSYRCGESLTVTLSATSGSFRGFLCQARTIKNVYETVGTLTASGSVVTNQNCGPGRALTNSESSPKTSVDFTWTAMENHGNVLFVCTVVQDISIYYLRRQMANISFAGNCDTSSYSPGTASTTEVVVHVSASADMASTTSITSTASSIKSETSSIEVTSKPIGVTTLRAYISSIMNSITTINGDKFTKTNGFKPYLTSPLPIYFIDLNGTAIASLASSNHFTDSTTVASSQSVNKFKGFKKHATARCTASNDKEVPLIRYAVLITILPYLVW